MLGSRTVSLISHLIKRQRLLRPVSWALRDRRGAGSVPFLSDFVIRASTPLIFNDLFISLKLRDVALPSLTLVRVSDAFSA